MTISSATKVHTWVREVLPEERDDFGVEHRGVLAYVDGKYAGRMRWDDLGMIDSVYVLPEFRRQGVATSMLEYARGSLGEDVYHSTDLTSDGDAWSQVAASKTGALNPADGLWWRCHPEGRPFSAEEATSRPWGTQDVQQSGYSCMAGPWELWGYWANHARVLRPDEVDVVAFTGTRTGSIGFEALVVPDMKVERRMSWGEFEEMLTRIPVPETVDVNTSAETWSQVAHLMLSSRPDSPAARVLTASKVASSLRTSSKAVVVYRAEHRPPGSDLESPESIGVHWTTRPLDYGYQHEPGWTRVVWHGVVSPEHIADTSDRFGEGEVVLRNGGSVHLTGRTERLDRGLVDVSKSGEPEFPMDLDVPTRGQRIGKTTVSKMAMPMDRSLTLRYEVHENARQTPGVNPVGVTWVYAYDTSTDKAVGWLAFCNRPLRPGTSYVKPRGEIYDLKVEEAYRRRGVATRLLEEARQIDPSVHHSWNLSGDGEAWSQAVASKVAWQQSQSRPHEITMPMLDRVRSGAKKLSLAEATTLAQRVLIDAGFPQGDQAEAVPHPSGYGKSSVAWDVGTQPPTPLVALANDMSDEFTTIHECAHIIRNGPSYAGQREGDSVISHDDQWFTTFARLLSWYATDKCWRQFQFVFGTEPSVSRTASIDPDREQVYAAERALPGYETMRAITDEQAGDIASRHVGQEVFILRTNKTPGGLEPGKYLFGVWLPGGPVIAAPPGYPLSAFEVYHETAHLLTNRGGALRGHGPEFRSAYLAILPEPLGGLIREQFVQRFKTAKTADWTEFQPPAHIQITSGGDAVPGGYNGYYIAWEKATGKKMGYLDYQSGDYDGERSVTIAMVEVVTEFRRQGVATVLLNALRHEFEGYVIDPGMTTPEGSAWWGKVGGLKGDLPTLRFKHLVGQSMGDGGPEDNERIDTLVAYDGDKRVGHISWMTGEGWTKGAVDALGVDDAYRRRGIATELLRRAQQIEPDVDPHHTPWFTDDGQVWARTTASLESNRLFWRFHPVGREFMPETATSTPLNNWIGDPTEPGFSAVRSPWHLFTYGAMMGWLTKGGPSKAWEDDIIGFTGKVIGEGHDHEPLVMPDMGVVLRFNWTQFVAELIDTPFPSGWNWNGRDGLGWAWLAKELAESRGDLWNDTDSAGALALHIIETFAPEALRVAASARGPFFHGTDSRLSVGDVLRPGSEMSRANYDYAEFGYSNDRVFLTTNEDAAWAYAKSQTHFSSTGYVYRVEPEGEVTSDPRPGGWGNQTEFSASSSRVVEVMRRLVIPQASISTTEARDEHLRLYHPGETLPHFQAHSRIVTSHDHLISGPMTRSSTVISEEMMKNLLADPETNRLYTVETGLQRGTFNFPQRSNSDLQSLADHIGPSIVVLDISQPGVAATGLMNGKPAIVGLGPGKRTEVALIHEMAHVQRGNTGGNDHGPDFLKHYLRLLRKHCSDPQYAKMLNGNMTGRYGSKTQKVSATHTVTTGDYQGIAFDYHETHRGEGGQEYLMIRESTSITARTPDGRMAGYLTVVVSTNEIGSVNVMTDHRRQGLATAMLRMAREQFPGLAHTTVPGQLSPSGEAWARVVGSKVAAYAGEYGQGGTIYRGLRADLPPDVDAKVRDLLSMETDEESYRKWGPHGGKKVQAGELIVRALEWSHWDSEYGLGKHWTESKDMARVGAQQGGAGTWGIILTATYTPSDVDPDSDPTRPFMESEAEVTLRPGAQITVTEVEVRTIVGNERVSYQPIRARA